MGVVEQGATPAPTRARQTEEPAWIRLWCVAVWGLLAVDFMWGGFPDRSEGAGWLESRGPLIPVAALVLVLFVLAAVQAKWSKRREWESAEVGRLGLGRCPAWFEYTAVGLMIVGSVLYAYAAFRSLGGVAADHALQRRAAVLLLLGSYAFLELIKWLALRGREEPEARKDGRLEAPGDLESRSDLEPFRRGLIVAFTVLPLGVFVAIALAGGRGGALAVALAALATLFAVAHLLAWWNRSVSDAPPGAVLPSLRSCPPLYGYVVRGLTMVLAMYVFLYVAFRAQNEHVGDSPHAVVQLAPLFVFLIGSLWLLLLLPMRRRGLRRRRDESAQIPRTST